MQWCNYAIDYHDDNKSFMRNVRSVQDSTENSLIRIFLWDKNVSFQNKVHDKDYTEYIKRAGYKPWLTVEKDIKVDQDALQFSDVNVYMRWMN